MLLNGSSYLFTSYTNFIELLVERLTDNFYKIDIPTQKIRKYKDLMLLCITDGRLFKDLKVDVHDDYTLKYGNLDIVCTQDKSFVRKILHSLQEDFLFTRTINLELSCSKLIDYLIYILGKKRLNLIHDVELRNIKIFSLPFILNSEVEKITAKRIELYYKEDDVKLKKLQDDYKTLLANNSERERLIFEINRLEDSICFIDKILILLK